MTDITEVKVINRSHHPLPQYATPLSAGMDLRANIDAPITLRPLERCLIPTGLFIALPPGYEAQVRPRSGLALKKGITVLNSPGTIDADYRQTILWLTTANALPRWWWHAMHRCSLSPSQSSTAPSAVREATATRE